MHNPCLVPVLKRILRFGGHWKRTWLFLALSCHLQTNSPQIEGTSTDWRLQQTLDLDKTFLHDILMSLLLDYVHVSSLLLRFRNKQRGQARIVCDIKLSEVNVGGYIVAKIVALWAELSGEKASIMIKIVPTDEASGRERATSGFSMHLYRWLVYLTPSILSVSKVQTNWRCKKTRPSNI